MKRNFYRVFCVIICFLAFSVLSQPIYAQGKKGVALGMKYGALLPALNVSWYYNWTPFPNAATSNIEFVPMLWGGKRLDEHWQVLKSAPVVPPIVLLINEPNRPDQANMSVDEVAELWSQLSTLGVQVSSPAPAGLLSSWLEQFMAVAAEENLKVNFITAHYYGVNADDFLAKIDETCRKYGLPVWITEFAVADFKNHTDFSEDDVADFMQTVLPELEKRPCVARYAWFSTGTSSMKGLEASRLFDEQGNLTKVGKIYATWQ